MILEFLRDNPATRWWSTVTEPPVPVHVSAPWRIGLAEWGRILARAVRGAVAEDFGMVASSIAFAAFLSILPLLSVVALSYGALVPRDEVLGNVSMLASILPDSAKAFVQEWLGKSLTRREGNGLALTASIALTLFGGRRVGHSLLHGIDIASGNAQDRDPIATQVWALGTVTAGALLLFAALLTISGLALLGKAIPAGIPGVARGIHLIMWLALTLGSALALVHIYRYVPVRAPTAWRWVIPGMLVAVASWLSATLIFQFYVTRLAQYDSIYGSLSAIVVLQLWLMLSAYILLFGAKVNAEAMRQVGIGTPPSKK
ncbi:MAG: YihY/virulence factor BrkB family protein [Parasphingorhabdus sp.]|tara:strand:+ start:3543 stop:4490 length:948 start_codon:yes stop_codon:yes gene_type:complete